MCSRTHSVRLRIDPTPVLVQSCTNDNTTSAASTNRRKDGTQAQPHPTAFTTTPTLYRIIQCSNHSPHQGASSNQNLCQWRAWVALMLAHIVAAWLLYAYHLYTHSTLLSSTFIFLTFSLLILCLVCWRLIRGPNRSVMEERVLVVPGVGVQLETLQWRSATDADRAGDAFTQMTQPQPKHTNSTIPPASLCPHHAPVKPISRSVRCFIPVTDIADVLINEGIQGCDVRYYLILLVKDRRNSHVDTGDGLDMSSASSGNVTHGSAPAPTNTPTTSNKQHLHHQPQHHCHQPHQRIILPFEHLRPRYQQLLPILAGLRAQLQLDATDSMSRKLRHGPSVNGVASQLGAGS